MRLKLTFFVLITIIAFVFNCSKSDKTYTIEIKDGVNYVHNRAPLWGDTLKVALEFVRQIGDIESDDENYFFYEQYDMGFDSEDNLYVLDGGNQRIQKFDSQGGFIASFGRKGEGPGEFFAPIHMCIDNEDKIYVADGGNNHFLIFTNEGKCLKTINMYYRQLGSFRILRDGNILVIYSPVVRPEQQATNRTLFHIVTQELVEKAGFGKLEDYKDDYFRNIGYNAVYFDTDANDNIYVSYVSRNRIVKYSPDGSIRFVADRPLNYDVVEKTRDIERSDGRILSKATLTTIAYNIAVDGNRRIWIPTVITQKLDEGEEDIFKAIINQREFQIFDEDGVWLGCLPIPHYYKRLRIFGNRLFLLDASVKCCIYEYKIVEK